MDRKPEWITTEIDKVRWVRQQEVDAKTQSLIDNGFSFMHEGVSCTFDTSDKGLAKLSIAKGVAKDKADKKEPYQQKMVMKDYKVITMDRDTIISTYDAMIAYGIGIYSQHADIIDSLKNLTLEELRAWKDPRP